MYQYTGRDDNMRASKNNLSGDALDKRIRVMIKIPRGVHTHVCNFDIHTNGTGIAVSLPTSIIFPFWFQQFCLRTFISYAFSSKPSRRKTLGI
jgi:hypothetical protein